MGSVLRNLRFNLKWDLHSPPLLCIRWASCRWQIWSQWFQTQSTRACSSFWEDKGKTWRHHFCLKNITRTLLDLMERCVLGPTYLISPPPSGLDLSETDNWAQPVTMTAPRSQVNTWCRYQNPHINKPKNNVFKQVVLLLPEFSSKQKRLVLLHQTFTVNVYCKCRWYRRPNLVALRVISFCDDINIVLGAEILIPNIRHWKCTILKTLF